MKVGVLSSHPIQYQAPYFRALAKWVDLNVYFAHRPTREQQGSGFGTPFEWDIDLTSGYTHTFLHNVSQQPGSTHFQGCDTPELAKVIALESFDAFIVSGWYLKTYWQAVWACRKREIPILVRGDSQLATATSLFKRGFKQLTHRLALRQFSAFLSVGRRNREYLLYYGVSESRIFFAPHFVDNDWFSRHAEASRERRGEIRSAWGASDSTFVVLFVGKFIPKKRPADILQAVAQLNGVLKIVAVFVGAGELDGHLRNVATTCGVNAIFQGFRNQTELPSIYASADVLVLPSDGGETWGLVVNEAMACGLPAIVSEAVGCGPDLIDEGRTGFTFRTGQVQDLAKQLARILHLRRTGFDFRSAVHGKSKEYSLGAGVNGTLDAIGAVTNSGLAQRGQS